MIHSIDLTVNTVWSGKRYLVELEGSNNLERKEESKSVERKDDSNSERLEPGQDYADLIDAASIEVGRLESTNGSGRKTISDVLEKISWVHEHLKTQEKSEKQKQIFKRALNVLKTLYQKLHKKKQKDQDDDREDSKATPTSRPSKENETTGATTAATSGGAPTKSFKSLAQEKPSIDEIPLAMKCDPVAAMTNCNSRCTKGKIKCKEDLQGKAFHEDVNYFSSKMLSESKYVSIFFKSNIAMELA